MARKEQQIVAQVVGFERSQTAQEVAAEHEAVVGFIVHDMTDADHTRMPGEALQLRLDIISAQVHPADHATDEIVLVGEVEQEFRLARVLPRLHRHRAVNAARRQQRLHVGRHDVDLQRRARLIHPGVFFAVVEPKVLM